MLASGRLAGGRSPCMACVGTAIRSSLAGKGPISVLILCLYKSNYSESEYQWTMNEKHNRYQVTVPEVFHRLELDCEKVSYELRVVCLFSIESLEPLI